eukprot:3200178-Amphidinium_carterae.1
MESVCRCFDCFIALFVQIVGLTETTQTHRTTPKGQSERLVVCARSIGEALKLARLIAAMASQVRSWMQSHFSVGSTIPPFSITRRSKFVFE